MNYFEELAKVYERWANSQGFMVTCRISIEDYYDCSNDSIGIGLMPPEPEFMEAFHFFNEKMGNGEFPSTIHHRLIPFLHELGHFMTVDDESLANDKFIRALFETTDDLTTKNYLYLPLERRATEWAIKFANEHWADVYALQCQLESFALNWDN